MKKSEITFVGIVLTIIFVATWFNLARAEILGRDMQRKGDLKNIASALSKLRQDGSNFPQAVDGKILACPPQENTRPCEWGQDPLESSTSAYLNPLPEDPLSPKGVEYLYLSNGRDFQLFASLERRDDVEFKPKIDARGLRCGNKICNFGIASSNDLKLEEDLSTYGN